MYHLQVLFHVVGKEIFAFSYLLRYYMWQPFLLEVHPACWNLMIVLKMTAEYLGPSLLKPFVLFFFLAAPMACGSSQARD